MPRDASELARRLAREAEALPPIPVQRTAPGPLLVGGRRSQYAGPVDVRPAYRTRIRSRRRRALDRCRLVRTRRSPRRDPRELRVPRLSRCRRRGARFWLPHAEPRRSPKPIGARRGSPEAARRLSPCRSRSRARSSRPTFAIAASRRSTMQARCGFIRAATIARTTCADGVAAGDDRRCDRSSGVITGAHRTWLRRRLRQGG